MEAEERKMYLGRMMEVQRHIEEIRREFGRPVMLDLETMACLETLMNTMEAENGWWDDLEVPKPTSELELLEMMIRVGWHPDEEWPDESFCDELVYEAVDEFARMTLETWGRYPTNG